MEEEKMFKTPKKVLARMQVVHLGKILFNLQFLLLALMLVSVLSFILPALYYLTLICIALISLFLVFANDKFISYWKGGETLSKVADVMTQSWKYTVPIALVISIAAIICLSLDKNQKHIGRIVVCGLVALAAAIILILKLINKGGA